MKILSDGFFFTITMQLLTNNKRIKYIPIKCQQRALQKAFIKACVETGLKKKKPKIHFHSLRHGYATEGLRSGVDLYTISKLLGHEDIGTTQIYTHISLDRKRKAINAL